MAEMTEDAWEKMVKTIEAIHRNEIMARYGKEAAKTANYGWGQSEKGLATKVYVEGGMVATTDYDDETGKIGKTVWMKYSDI